MSKKKNMIFVCMLLLIGGTLDSHLVNGQIAALDSISTTESINIIADDFINKMVILELRNGSKISGKMVNIVDTGLILEIKNKNRQLYRWSMITKITKKKKSNPGYMFVIAAEIAVLYIILLATAK